MNIRLVKTGDVIEDLDGNPQLVRGVTLVIHLANGEDVAFDAPSEVVEVEDLEEISDELRAQIEAMFPPEPESDSEA